MTPAPAEVAAVLEAVSGALAERGWRQGPRTLAEINACRWPGLRLGDALWHVAGATDPRDHCDLYSLVVGAEYALAEWIGERPDTGPVSWRDPESWSVDVDAWQDAPGRTVGDVVRACYGAARLAWPRRERVPQSVDAALDATSRAPARTTQDGGS